MPYSWRNNLSTTVDSFLQVLSKWLEHFVEDEFIIEPCLDVVAGHGQFHAIPFPGVDAAEARGRQDFSLVAYLLDGALCIAARAEIQPAVVLRIKLIYAFAVCCSHFLRLIRAQQIVPETIGYVHRAGALSTFR